MSDRCGALDVAYRADFFCVMTLKNLKKYLRIHFFFNFFFVASSRYRNLAWFSSASLIRPISMSAEVGSEKKSEKNSEKKKKI